MFWIFKTKEQRLADFYIRQCELEKKANEKKESALQKLREYVAENGVTTVGSLHAYERREQPTLNLDEAAYNAFEKDLKNFNVRSCFVQKLSVSILRDAIELKTDPVLMKLVKKHKVEIVQSPKYHFKRKP